MSDTAPQQFMDPPAGTTPTLPVAEPTLPFTVEELNQEAMRGTSTLLMGPPGTGKTYAIPTLVKAGLEVFVIITDPGGEESLIDAMNQHDLPMDKIHWHYVAMSTPSWDALLDAAKKINTFGYEDLAKMKSGITKQDYNQMFDLLDCCANFKDDRTGEEYGPIDSFGYDRAVVIDSLSGVNLMAMALVVGGKPTAHQGEWGVAMNMEEKLIYKWTSDLKCFFVLIAHVDKIYDEMAGKPQFMVSLLGNKLAPKVPRTFSDVILSVKEGDKFFWSTSAKDVDLKSRTLPLRERLDPDFGQIVDVWRRRMKSITD